MNRLLLLSLVLYGSATYAQTKQESPADYLAGSALTAKVRAQLIADPMINSLPISVISYKNQVQLCGFVDEKSQEKRAVEIARRVSGVTMVFDNLLLR
jgi:hyperosmotically inducible protein